MAVLFGPLLKRSRVIYSVFLQEYDGENIVETETIAALVLLAAMGCLVLSIYKVKEWYRKNTRAADSNACEQEKVNLKMMEQARRREQVLKPEPPPDG